MHEVRKKPIKNRQLDWLFFVQRATGLDLYGLWTSANRLSTHGSTGIVGNVAASLLAKNLRAPRQTGHAALSLTFFASKLAPTRISEPRLPQPAA
ncbi:hypothetical protein CYL20_15345 [Pseudomonas palleroniana]|uniref:Uncharacterized protein n=1 Tax=Pseudomonas palleroniana TaxID=191390 RepID=A0A2L1JBL1_9PSED|nr:hypothetical protein CYL20_15345 [Pseudomonas palleroniana]